jgi:hypothetical protein
MGGAGRDEAQGVALDPTGNVYTVGYFSGTADFDPGLGVRTLRANGERSAFVSKLDSAGQLLWARRFGGTTPSEPGTPISPVSADAQDVAVDSVGNVYVVGHFNGLIDFDPGSTVRTYRSQGGAAGGVDAFVAKLDPSGGFLWATRLGGVGDDAINGIAVDGADNVYVVGRFQYVVDFGDGVHTAIGDTSDAFVSKLDAHGNVLWARAMGGPGADLAWDVAVDAQSNVYSVGYFELVGDFDPAPLHVALLGPLPANLGYSYVSKLDALGRFVWAQSGASAAFYRSGGIAVDGAANVYVGADFFGSSDFNPGPGVSKLDAGHSAGVFVWKLTSSGTFAWARQLGRRFTEEQLSGLAVDEAGHVYSIGWFYDNGRGDDFDPGPGVFELHESNGGGFISVLDSAGNFLWAGQIAAGLDAVVADATTGSAYVGSFGGRTDFDPGPGVAELESPDQSQPYPWDAFVLKLGPLGA